MLRLGGGRNKERAQRYREYVESAVREGLKQSPWEELREQVVLGSERFLEQVRGHVKGDEQEQRNAERLTVVRPELESSVWNKCGGRSGRNFEIGTVIEGATWCCI